ncbi:MAG: hypothetical protein ACF8OB_17745 [Phycisphaeraceae bacterium JB051]
MQESDIKKHKFHPFTKLSVFLVCAILLLVLDHRIQFNEHPPEHWTDILQSAAGMWLLTMPIVTLLIASKSFRFLAIYLVILSGAIASDIATESKPIPMSPTGEPIVSGIGGFLLAPAMVFIGIPLSAILCGMRSFIEKIVLRTQCESEQSNTM